MISWLSFKANVTLCHPLIADQCNNTTHQCPEAMLTVNNPIPCVVKVLLHFYCSTNEVHMFKSMHTSYRLHPTTNGNQPSLVTSVRGALSCYLEQ